MFDKTQLRQQQKAALKNLTSSQRQAESQSLYQQLFEQPAWQRAQTVAITLNLPFELATQPIIEAAWQAGKTVGVPLIEAGQLGFVTITPETEYQAGALNIAEPVGGQPLAQADIDLTLVPGLAFTSGGERLGFGGGFYDRFLADYDGDSLALALSVQLLDQLPIESHDQLVHQVLQVQ
ncbi:5-formyltetrahydrofolate cyclo-ligase [Leuconostocaceae bacterium ESL0723]|nr:5-formyltetrahydrofolate cyclo-ligase [Leuconostocaceae bacterium ESL0723]